MNTGLAVLLGATILAGAVSFSTRYSVTNAPGDPAYGHSIVWVFDHWTKKMWLCGNYFKTGGGTQCSDYAPLSK